MAPLQINLPVFITIKSILEQRFYQRLPTAPFSRSYWVIPGKLLAGEYAGSIRSRKAGPRLLSLMNAGIRVWIDLTEPREHCDYWQPLSDIASQLNRKVVYHRFPVRDFHAPSHEQMEAVLNVIDDSLEGGLPVYVHCWGGIGRTGTIIGCYLVRQGLTGEEALKRINQLRSGTPNCRRKSPETSEQRKMVLTWASDS